MSTRTLADRPRPAQAMCVSLMESNGSGQRLTARLFWGALWVSTGWYALIVGFLFALAALLNSARSPYPCTWFCYDAVGFLVKLVQHFGLPVGAGLLGLTSLIIVQASRTSTRSVFWAGTTGACTCLGIVMVVACFARAL